MQENNFDKYAARYKELLHESTRISGHETTFFAERKIQEVWYSLSSSLREREALRFLDYGCGIGLSESFIGRYLPKARIFDADSSAEAVAVAREANRHIPAVTFAVSDGKTIPFQEEFDIIFVAGVLHHIHQDDRLPLLRQFHERLTSDGLLFVFEHNPLNPFTRHIVRSCIFDKDASLLPSPVLRHLLRKAVSNNVRGDSSTFSPAFSALWPPARGGCTQSRSEPSIFSLQGKDNFTPFLYNNQQSRDKKSSYFP